MMLRRRCTSPSWRGRPPACWPGPRRVAGRALPAWRCSAWRPSRPPGSTRALGGQTGGAVALDGDVDHRSLAELGRVGLVHRRQLRCGLAQADRHVVDVPAVDAGPTVTPEVEAELDGVAALDARSTEVELKRYPRRWSAFPPSEPDQASSPAIGLELVAAPQQSHVRPVEQSTPTSGSPANWLPLTLSFTLPPSKVASLAIDWSNDIRRPLVVPLGTWTAGLVIELRLEMSPAPYWCMALTSGSCV